MDWLWDSAWNWVTSHFHLTISPFWYWVFVGAGVCALATFISWFFPSIRPFAGAVVMAVIAYLSGYRRAEYDAEKRQKEQAAKAARKARVDPPRDQWRW